MSELRFWLWLASREGVRARSKLLLLEQLGDVQEVYFARDGDYKRLGFLTEAELASLGQKSLNDSMRIMDACADGDIGIVTLRDAAYPRRLRETYAPPLALYVRGRLPNIDELCAVAVVGTRSATPYGLKMAQQMGYGICKCGGMVVSGLTRGVDAAAAHGAVMANGRCVGVLRTAIDDPGAIDRLAADVAVTGAVISEYAPGSKSRRSNFRERNRITAGLAVATLVVEAPERSGALGFADESLELGREVFAVPGNADAPNSAGTNRLIMEGASPVLSAWDMLSHYKLRFAGLKRDGTGMPAAQAERWAGRNAAPEEGGAEPAREETERPKKRKKAPLRGLKPKKDIDKPEAEEYIDLVKQLEGLSEKQLRIVAAITAPGTHVDDIAEGCGLGSTEVLGELTMLQLLGFVRQEEGKRFSLNIIQK